MDAIQKANSGHPGLPMAMAPAAFVLFRKIMRHDPSDPAWPDRDRMEGIASEAASLAGQLGLGRIVYLYDDNDISLDGPTSLSFDRENVDQRFEAYGWHVQDVHDANDTLALETAIKAAQKVEDKPSLIRVKSVIGYPSPNKSGTSKAHGAALGDEEVALTKEVMGWDPEKKFFVPDGVYETF